MKTRFLIGLTGRFPRRVRLGPQSVGWVEAEIDDYLEQLVAARDDEAEAKS